MKSIRVGLLAVLALAAYLCPALAQEPTQSAEQRVKELQAELDALKAKVRDQIKIGEIKPASQFLRVVRGTNGKATSLDTAIVRYKKGDVTVDLVGAVHVGEKSYYESLNKQFKEYDVLLYELVGEKGAKPERAPPPTEIDPEQPLTGIRSMQGMMTQLLGLQHQMEGVDYTPKNFVHADLSPEELGERMKERGETPLVLILEQVATMMKQANLEAENPTPKNSADVVDESELITSAIQSMLTGQPSPEIKRYMATQFDDLEKQSKAFGSGVSRLILDDRNAACFKVLDEQLAAKKKFVGIFYGAAHLPDMEKRMLERGFKAEGTIWLKAWNLK